MTMRGALVKSWCYAKQNQEPLNRLCLNWAVPVDSPKLPQGPWSSMQHFKDDNVHAPTQSNHDNVGSCSATMRQAVMSCKAVTTKSAPAL